jgi:Fe2+ or Zn2+ uptake regulation protein
MKQAYMRLLSLLEQEAPSSVDTKAQRLLELIALAHDQGKPLTVNEAMQFHDLASPSTIHRKLMLLLDAGLIIYTFEGKNRRTKYLLPSPKAHAHFEKLGEYLLDLART